MTAGLSTRSPPTPGELCPPKRRLPVQSQLVAQSRIPIDPAIAAGETLPEGWFDEPPRMDDRSPCSRLIPLRTQLPQPTGDRSRKSVRPSDPGSPLSNKNDAAPVRNISPVLGFQSSSPSSHGCFTGPWNDPYRGHRLLSRRHMTRSQRSVRPSDPASVLSSKNGAALFRNTFSVPGFQNSSASSDSSSRRRCDDAMRAFRKSGRRHTARFRQMRTIGLRGSAGLPTRLII